MAELLFELGVEELPVSEIKSLLNQIRDRFASSLKGARVSYGSINTEATNRRLVLDISDMALKAEDLSERILGPARRIAYDGEGNATLALSKFLEKNGSRATDLIEVETKKGKYLALDRRIEGNNTADLLQKLIPRILDRLNFRKAMNWNETRIPFSRPITNILCLFADQPVPFSFAGIHTSGRVRGHSLLSDADFEVKRRVDYFDNLKSNRVILAEADRRARIEEQIESLEKDLLITVQRNDEMLDYYVFNNEYPVLFCGEFHEKYLDLPHEVITTFMTREKKLLPVTDAGGTLRNRFVGVSNVPDSDGHVVSGNEKVIQATFEDAKFFWDSDRQLDFIKLRKQLKNVSLGPELGTFFEKTERLPHLVGHLAGPSGMEHLADPLKRAAHHCKNDLLTQMVREFPSLQGIMSGLYLKEAGEAEGVWRSAYSLYEPKGFSEIPFTDSGAALLSMADKLDNLAGFLNRGDKISSSKDPLGIRRDANAIIKIMLHFEFDIDLDAIIRQTLSVYSDSDPSPAVVEKMLGLFRGRLASIFRDFLAYPYDLVQAVLAQPGLPVYRLFLRVEKLQRLIDRGTLERLQQIHRRLKNIIADRPVENLSEDLLSDPAEKVLFGALCADEDRIVKRVEKNEIIEAVDGMLAFREKLDRFFDEVLVMAEDDKVRRNRIALLQRFDALLSLLADFSLLVEPGSAQN